MRKAKARKLTTKPPRKGKKPAAGKKNDAPADPLRDALRQAHERRDAAQKVRDRIAASVERADSLINEIEGTLSTFHDVDARIANERANAIKDSLNCDRPPLTLAVSRELQALSTQRLDAENRLTATRQARQVLQGELAEADQTCRRVETEVAEAALAVLAPIAEKLGARMSQIEGEAASLRMTLVAYAALRRRLISPALATVPAGSPDDWLPMPPALRVALREPPMNAGITHANADSVDAWRAAFGLLLVNPNAEATIEPPPFVAPPRQVGVYFRPAEVVEALAPLPQDEDAAA